MNDLRHGTPWVPRGFLLGRRGYGALGFPGLGIEGARLLAERKGGTVAEGHSQPGPVRIPPVCFPSLQRRGGGLIAGVAERENTSRR